MSHVMDTLEKDSHVVLHIGDVIKITTKLPSLPNYEREPRVTYGRVKSIKSDSEYCSVRGDLPDGALERTFVIKTEPKNIINGIAIIDKEITGLHGETILYEWTSPAETGDIKWPIESKETLPSPPTTAT